MAGTQTLEIPEAITIQHTRDEVRTEARRLHGADHTLAHCKAPEVGRFRAIDEQWHVDVMALLARIGGEL